MWGHPSGLEFCLANELLPTKMGADRTGLPHRKSFFLKNKFGWLL
jgi:hypothetical protein